MIYCMFEHLNNNTLRCISFLDYLIFYYYQSNFYPLCSDEKLMKKIQNNLENILVCHSNLDNRFSLKAVSVNGFIINTDILMLMIPAASV